MQRAARTLSTVAAVALLVAACGETDDAVPQAEAQFDAETDTTPTGATESSTAASTTSTSPSAEASATDLPTTQVADPPANLLVNGQLMRAGENLVALDGRHELHLQDDGTVSMRLNCNLARGAWSVEPSGDGTSGRFEFGPLAMTRAICPPPSMDEQIAAQAAYIRGYLLKDGMLYLSLMADGGVYAWRPDD